MVKKIKNKSGLVYQVNAVFDVKSGFYEASTNTLPANVRISDIKGETTGAFEDAVLNRLPDRLAGSTIKFTYIGLDHDKAA